MSTGDFTLSKQISLDPFKEGIKRGTSVGVLAKFSNQGVLLAGRMKAGAFEASQRGIPLHKHCMRRIKSKIDKCDLVFLDLHRGIQQYSRDLVDLTRRTDVLPTWAKW